MFIPPQNWKPEDIIIASFNVDCQKGFTPLCPNELPVPDGHNIVTALNKQAEYADIHVCSVDCHPPNAMWIADTDHPQFAPITGHAHLDMYWNAHCIIGTKGFELLDGLPLNYDFKVYKGMEPNTHPYGACYHYLNDTLSTGVIEFLRSRNVDIVILGGLAENYCVATTAMQLAKAHFKVFVNLAATRAIGDPTTTRLKMREHGISLLNTIEDFTLTDVLLNQHYVYIYLDPRHAGYYNYGNGLHFSYEPFYVGKGCNRRYKNHIYHINTDVVNSHKTRKIKKILDSGLSPIIVFYAKYLSDETAKKIERSVIKTIGRYPAGVLTNKTDGGDGCEGYKHSENTKQQLRKLRMGKVPWNKGLTADQDERVQLNAQATSKSRRKKGTAVGEKNPMWGKVGELNPQFGKPKTSEHRTKIAQTKLGNKNHQSKIMSITAPDGFTIETCAADFARQYGEKYKINRHFLYYRARHNTDDGWEVLFVNKGD